MKAKVEARLPESTWSVPVGWSWSIVRVIHCMPDDQVDGWRVQLQRSNNTVIEVIHRDLNHARAIACEAAGEMFPATFKEWAR